MSSADGEDSELSFADWIDMANLSLSNSPASVSKDLSVDSIDPRRCYLQKVPPEIRLEIFRYLLVAPPGYYIHELLSESSWTKPDPEEHHNTDRVPNLIVYHPTNKNWMYDKEYPVCRKIYGRPINEVGQPFELYPQILATCKLFNSEAQYMLFSCNTFSLANPGIRLYRTWRVPFDLAEVQYNKSWTIKSLRLDFKFGGSQFERRDFWAYIDKFFPNVSQITGIISLEDVHVRCIMPEWLYCLARHMQTHASPKRLECLIYDTGLFSMTTRETDRHTYECSLNSMYAQPRVSQGDIAGPSESELNATLHPHVPSFVGHRLIMKRMKDLFYDNGYFQRNNNCWQWEFEIITSFRYPSCPQIIVKMIYNRNPGNTVLCRVTGDFGNMTRAEVLD
ncbi:hypothetical protein BT63DRAFT_92245 [Microthyrium microscopicum]|uniref:F-box domain-containing protein n=1 Tax=Microthyrium microscopicum TaxID=703497 RepID=A0A6A6TXL8_9PEZI|nr:hypothetical protein BT63DRAFT_92245 [Microthyrium microscopicum]